jgi:hypothetical protein
MSILAAVIINMEAEVQVARDIAVANISTLHQRRRGTAVRPRAITAPPRITTVHRKITVHLQRNTRIRTGAITRILTSTAGMLFSFTFKICFMLINCFCVLQSQEV